MDGGLCGMGEGDAPTLTLPRRGRGFWVVGGVDFGVGVGYGWGCDGLLAGFGCLLLLSAYIGVRGFCVCQTA